MDIRPSIKKSTDILVVGGGAAGLAAAVTAARQGHSVILLERHGFCGGGAVAGLSGTICGIYEATPGGVGESRQLVYGFLEEFKARLDRLGGLGPLLLYGHTYTHVHDPLCWREAADALLAETKVEVIYHAVVHGVLTEGGEAVEGVIAWTKEGPLEIRARLVIDASGDADVLAMAGLPSFVGDNGAVQNPTMIFRLGGVDVETFWRSHGPNSIMGHDISELIQSCHRAGTHYLPRSKVFLFPGRHPGEVLCNCTRIIGRDDGRELNPLSMRDFTEAETEGRRQVREYTRFFKQHLRGFAGAFVFDTGVQVGVRQTRQGKGVRMLMNADVVAGAKFADGVARSAWPIELHRGDTPKVEWLYNDYYEVPYGCFVPERGENLLFAGRCLSAQHEAVASARVTAQCFSYGHAIGHAASLCLKERLAPRQLEGAAVRDALNRDGARLN
jgi:hypothetical protein